MPEPIKTGQPLITKTKTKTRTKIGVATLVLVVGLGVMAGIGNIRTEMICGSGSRVGQSCRSDLDCRGKIKERTNARCIKVVLPDLAVQSVEIDPTTRVPTIVIINKGRVGIPEATSTAEIPGILIEWLNSTGETISRSSVGIPGLAAGATQAYDGSVLSPPPASATRVRFTLDRDLDGIAKVAESNEFNNVWQGNLPLPDLVVQTVTFDPATRIPTVTIINRGHYVAQWGIPETNTLQVQGTWLPSIDNPFSPPDTVLEQVNTGSPVTTLEPMASTSVTFPLSQILSQIPTIVSRVLICVDTGIPGVIESNETNNCWEGNLPTVSSSSIRFTLHPASPSGAGVPGFNTVLRFNVSASGGDAYLRNIRLGTVGRDGAETRWPENDSFRRSWALYDAADLNTRIGTTIEVNSIRWDGSVWLTEAGIGFGEPGLAIVSDTAKSFVLKADTIGASGRADDTVRFDVQRVNWQTSSGSSRQETGPSGAPLIIGNEIVY